MFYLLLLAEFAVYWALPISLISLLSIARSLNVLRWSLVRAARRKLSRAVDSYKGKRSKDGKRQGYGVQTYANGSVYEGDFRDDQYWGRGKLTLVAPKGKGVTIYDGEFHSDKRHGQGEVTYADGCTFIGSFSRGRKEGRGVYTYPNLDSISGIWKDNQCVKGIITTAISTYTGEINKALKPHGKGTLKKLVENVSPATAPSSTHLPPLPPLSPSKSPQGKIKDVPMTPKRGQVFDEDGSSFGVSAREYLEEIEKVYDIYEGVFVDGLLECETGSIEYGIDNSRIEGSFKKNLAHGDCVITRADNSKFFGTFVGGVAKPFGKYISSSGDTYEGLLQLLSVDPTCGVYSPKHSPRKTHESIFASPSKEETSMNDHDLSDNDEDNDEVREGGGEGKDVLNSSTISSRNGEAGETYFMMVDENHEQEKHEIFDMIEATGKGKLTLMTGDVYVGEFQNGLKHGVGKMLYSDGDEYEGSYIGGKYDGGGVYRTKSGKIYKGQFSQGEKSGHGVLQFASGAMYSGDFLNNAMWGHGEYNFINGDRYIGSFVDGKRSGLGKMTFKNGNTFDGEYDDDLQVYGVYQYRNGNCFEGHFKENKFDGQGTFTWSDGPTYTGEWENGKAHGVGKYVCEEFVYEGGWLENKRDTSQIATPAIIKYKNGDEYAGSVIKGKLTGSGVMKKAGGQILEGEFYEGVFQG